MTRQPEACIAAGTEWSDLTGSLERPTTVMVANSVRMRWVNSLVTSTRRLFPMSEEAARAALDESGLSYRLVRHGPVNSLAEAAVARGVSEAAVVKTLVVRRGEDDYLFVLVPGDRTISWPKLRALLDVHRLSMPDAATAKAATGYARGTITPFGSLHPWPVIADERMLGRTITLGGGAHGVAVAIEATPALAALDAEVADVTDPE